MRTPRELFLISGHATNMGKIVSNESFEPACEYALMQLQSELPPSVMPGVPTDPYIGFDANSQLVGARRVLQILQTLNEPVKPPQQPKRDKLNYANP